MSRLRKLAIGGVLGTLALTVVAAPSSAADTKGTLAIINGIPGKRVDVCLNGDEIRSGLGYGGHVFQNDKGTGPKSLKFYEHDPRRCKGAHLGQTSFTLDPAEDLTIVVTKKSPKVITFVNLWGEIPPAGPPIPGLAVIQWGSASEMVVNLRLRLWGPDPEIPTSPNADPLFAKGQGFDGIFESADLIAQLRATLPDVAGTLAVARSLLVASHRYEWILVGSNPGNARMVILDRAISQPSP